MKGRAGPEIIDANNRILYPMRRTTPKTAADPGWERISWDEALAICAQRIAAIRDETGPESVAFAVTTKSGTAIADGIEWVDRFVRVFGSPNVAGAVDICNWHKDVAHKFTFGVGMPVADYAHAGLIMLWGHNPTSTWLAQADAIARGRKAGAKLLVIDPRNTLLAKQADVWLRVKPGTDAALALGLANLLIKNGGVDLDFVRRWTNGPLLVNEADGRFLRAREIAPAAADGYMMWNVSTNGAVPYDTRFPLDESNKDAVALFGAYNVTTSDGRLLRCRPSFDHYARACRDWEPDRVEHVTDVPAERLRAAAALLAEHDRIAYHAWNGIGQSTNATQNERAVATLYALRGSFDAIGGNRILAKHPVNKVDALSLIPKQRLSRALGAAERPIGPPAEGRVKPIDVYRALATGRPYPIRALIGFGTNHLLTQGDTDEVRRGLEAAEFHVQCDIVETPVARYADIVLPVSTPWERESLRVGFEISEDAENLIQLRPASVSPRGESRSDIEIVFALATRLGLGDQFFGGDPEAGWNHILEPLGLTAADIRAQGGRVARPQRHTVRKYADRKPDGAVGGFATETRRVELYSELLLRNGQPPVPTQDVAFVDKAYPLVLTSMKNGYFCHSQHHGVASLRKRSRYPELQINKKAAAARGISDGDWVAARNDRGEARFVARCDASLAEDVVAAEFGWWEECEPLGGSDYPISGRTSSNFNALVSAQQRDPVSGSVAHKAVHCDVVPLEASRPKSWPGFRTVRVDAVRRESSRALSIRLSRPDGHALPGFAPGQHLMLRASDRLSKDVITRAYSLTCAGHPDATMSYEICVGLAEPGDGRPSMSRLLHARLERGDLLEIEAPRGSFTLPLQSSVPLVFVATGVGITPFMSHLEAMAALGVGPEVLLLYGNRNSEEHAFRWRLRELSDAYPSLSIVNVYSRPLPHDTGYEISGRVNAALIADELIRRRPRIYLCGSEAMISSMKIDLEARGVPRFNIFSEAFTAPDVKIAGDVDQTFSVTFMRSGKSMSWTPAAGTLLECAERLGIDAPSGCRVGQCESCACQILSGNTAQCAGAYPEENDIVFTCQGVPTSDLVLDL